MTKINKDRLTDIEVQSSHLQRTVDELSDVVAVQAKEIDLLTRRVQMLMERMAEEDIVSGDAAPLADQKPPHW